VERLQTARRRQRTGIRRRGHRRGRPAPLRDRGRPPAGLTGLAAAPRAASAGAPPASGEEGDGSEREEAVRQPVREEARFFLRRVGKENQELGIYFVFLDSH